MKIFEKYNFEVKGNVLSKSDFRIMQLPELPPYNTDKIRHILEKAENYLTEPIPMMTLSEYRSYAEQGSTVIYSRPYWARMDMLAHMTVAERHEGKGRFIDKILDVIWAMLDESTWMLPEHTAHLPNEETKRTKVPAAVGDKYPHGLELGACYRAATVALAYYYFKDKFDEVSPFINERIVYVLKDRIINPFIKYRFWWEGVEGNKVNNWCPWNICNTLFVIALVEDDLEVREEAVRISLEFLDNYLNWCKNDGGCDEGPTYWVAGAACMFDSLEIIEDMTGGKIKIYDEPLIKAIGEYYPRANITGRYFVNFADSRSVGGADGDMIVRFGKKCSSDILTSFGKTMLKIIPVNFEPKVMYRSTCSLLTETVDTSDFTPKAATDTYFPDLKVMILRESENPDTGIFLAIKGGDNNESHNHNDVGSFIVYKNGSPVLIDAGVGEYTKQTFSADRYKIWSMQSLYHNLPAFDGIGQVNGAQYASRDEIYDKDRRSYTLEIADAYDKACGVKSLVRSASLNGDTVTVSDSFELEDEKTVSFIFVTHIKPEVIERGKIKLNMDSTLSYDEALDAHIEEFDPVGMKTVGSWGTEFLYRIHLTVKAKSGKFTFTVR